MSRPDQESHEPVTVTDKRRIDPVTGQLRDAAPGAVPSEPRVAPADTSSDTGDKVAELTADLQRVQADFANYRKRALRDQQVAAERGKATVVTQLLGVLDDIDRARSHGDLESGPLKSVTDKLSAALEGLGLSAFGEEGGDFDPSLHEAVQHEGEGSKPIVGSVMRRGYRLGDHVLRHALVGVVDTVEDDEPDTTDTGPDNGDGSRGETAESESSAG